MLKWFVSLFVGCTVHHATFAADTLKAGVGRADITPEVEVLNWVTGKPYGQILDRLFVQAIVLDDGKTKVALVRWDMVDVSESARDEVRQAVSAALKMPAENIMVHASHTHSAPWAPVYSAGHRGQERDTWWALMRNPVQNEFPPFQRWMARIIAASVEAATKANDSAQSVSVAIGRISAAEFLYNRRPRMPRWGMAEAKAAALSQGSSEWRADVAPAGAAFGPMDRTFTLISFRTADDKSIASLYHLACHAVSIYSANSSISADWPGMASRTISSVLGGESLFLQGCSGDITPWRRGEAAVATMAGGLADKAKIVSKQSAKLVTSPLQVGRTEVELPLTAAGKKRTGAETVRAEVQVITCGPLALVALPGEPLTELNTFIRERSPFPQTLVLGYSNGNGVHYVGMPHEKARGGYEMGTAGAGTEEAGPMLIEAAVKVLNELVERAAPPNARR